MKFILFLMACVMLHGCATTNIIAPQWGMLTATTFTNIDDIVNESVLEISSNWAPAKTQLTTAISYDDNGFGEKLKTSLRQVGYKLDETETSNEHNVINYLLDGGEDDIYRLLIKIGDQSISRAYINSGGTLLPAGQWIMRGI